MLFRSLDRLDTREKFAFVGSATAAGANKKELVTDGVAMPKIVRKRVPHERSFVLEAPRFDHWKTFSEQRRSNPQEKNRVVFGHIAHV